MEFPLTKYAVVGVFSVMFLSAIDAFAPMELFYELYTEHTEEVTYVIDKAMHPMFREANDALCRCVIERTGDNVSHTDESVEAFISEAEVYNFLYEKPRYNIGTNLIACLKNQEYTKFYIAFSASEDEYFYVQVFERNLKTARVLIMFRIAGLKDNDQKLLSKSPYWCRVTVKIHHELAAYNSMKSNIDVKMKKKEEESYVNSPFQSKIISAKKTYSKGPSNYKDREKGCQSSYFDHTAAKKTRQALVANNENSSNMLEMMTKEKGVSYKQHVGLIFKKSNKPVKNTTKYEEPSDDDNCRKLPQNYYGSHTTAKSHHASATHTKEKNNIVAKVAMEKMTAYYAAPRPASKTNMESDKKTSGEEPLYENNQKKLSQRPYSSHAAAETSHSSVKHSETMNNIVTKRPPYKLPLTYMLQNNNDCDEETSGKRPSNYNDWEKLSQNPYLCRDAVQPSHASAAHSKNGINIDTMITTKKRPSYKLPLMSVIKKKNDSHKETWPPIESFSMKPCKGQIEIEDNESSDAVKRQLNDNDREKRSQKSYWCRTSAANCHASAIQTKKKNDDIITKIRKEKRPSYKLFHTLVMQKNNDSDENTSDEDLTRSPYRSHTAAETSHASIVHSKKESNIIIAKIPETKRPSYKHHFTPVLKTNNDSDDETPDEGPSNDNDRKKQSRNILRSRTSAEASHTSVEHNKKKSDLVAKFTNEKRLLYPLLHTPALENNNNSDEDTSEEEQPIKRLPRKPSKGLIEVESDESLGASEGPSNDPISMKPSKGSIDLESEESSEV